MNWDDEFISWEEFRRMDRLLAAEDELRQGPSLGDILLQKEGLVREMVAKGGSDSATRVVAVGVSPLGPVIHRYVDLGCWTARGIWRVGALSWILPYCVYFQFVLEAHFVSKYAVVAALLMVLVLPGPLDDGIKSHPVGAGWTWHHVWQPQTRYLVAAPVLFRAGICGLRFLHQSCARAFGNAFDVEICLSDEVVFCFHPTYPGAACDRDYRRMMLDAELQRLDYNVDDPEYDWHRRSAGRKSTPCGWDLYYCERKYAARRQTGRMCFECLRDASFWRVCSSECLGEL